jgi:hypothetical protein
LILASKYLAALLLFILTVGGAVVADATFDDASVTSQAKTQTESIKFRGCDPVPAACGEVSWVAGLDKYLADQVAFYAALAEASKSSGPRSSGGGGGGRDPSGCVGGESACIPTTPGTCVLPAYICARESSAINKWNYGGSGASGKYQAMPGTWGGYAGYQYAADAPESVQDQWATELWNNGRGCSHWSAC